MIKNETSIVDDRGYNQGFKETPALKKRMERRADWMIDEMSPIKFGKVLEIGCGTGYLSYYIAQKTKFQVTGSDLCVPFIQEAKEKYKASNLSYDTLDFNKASTEVNDSFHFIIGNGILHHLYNNLTDVLETFKRLLQPGGKIIFMEPNIYNPYVAAIFNIEVLRKWAKLEPEEMAFSKGFISKKLREAKFKDIKVEYKDFLLPGTPTPLIKPSISIGNTLEKTPVKFISQSILISASI